MSRFLPLIAAALLLASGLASVRSAEPLPGGAQLPARSAKTLSLAELEQLVLAHPALGRAAAQVAAARGRQFQAGRYPNPELAYDAGSIGADGTAGTQGFFIDQELITAGKRQLDEAAAAWERTRHEWEAEGERFAVLHDVRRTWVGLLAIEAQHSLAREALHDWEQLLEQTRRIAAGDNDEAVRPDVILADIRLRRQRLALRSIETRALAGWQQLAAVAGQPTLRPAAPRESIEDSLLWTVDPELLWQEVTANSPQLRAAQAEVSRRRVALQRQCAQVVPNVTVRAGAEYDFSADQPQGLLRVTVPLRVYDRNTGNILAAEAEIRAAQLELEHIELELRRRLAQALGQMEEHQALAREFRDHVLPQARRAYRRYFQRFVEGQASYSDAESAQDNYLSRSLEYIEALLQLRRAEAAIVSLLPEARPGLRLGE